MQTRHDIFYARSYEVHRNRVLSARPIVDSTPVPLQPGHFARYTKFKEDADEIIERHRENFHLLVALNNISRIHGATDNFRLKGTDKILRTTVPDRIKALEKIEEKNLKLGKIYLCARSEVDDRTTIPLRLDNEREKKRKARAAFQVPHKILAKYTKVDIPRDQIILKTLLRPKIWLGLEVKGVRSLGSITIELLTEAAPTIVLELVRLCKLQEHERLKCVRIFPTLWMENEMKLDEDSLIGENIEYDMRAIDHGAHSYILSFSLDRMKIRPEGFMNFSISFRPLEVLNKHTRVGFGRVLGGFKNLKCLPDFGTKNGKTIKQILITDCGLF